MKIIVYDAVKTSVENTCSFLKENVRADDSVQGFSNTEDVIKYVSDYLTDTAFVCFHDGDASGLKLVEKLREINDRINIVFVSDSNQYMQEAFDERISGFLKRPVTKEDIRREMENLRYHIEEFRKAELGK